MKAIKWLLFAVVLAVLNTQFAVCSHAGLFKMDFGTLENFDELPDWDEFETFFLADFENEIASWPLTDYSTTGPKDSDVVLTIRDNLALSEETGQFGTGMTANNPTHEQLDVEYDGILVPWQVKDDYLYRVPDVCCNEMLFRWENLNPGTYNVTLFEGRTTDNTGQYAKLWVESDPEGKGEPAEENTGNFAGFDPETGAVNEEGNPVTIEVTIKPGEYLWYAHMEDCCGGISGIIIRQTGTVGPSGDFNGNGSLDAEDIDLLSAEARKPTSDPKFDLSGDGTVNDTDRRLWVTDPKFKKTWFGDANLDGEFSSTDFVFVFQIGKYERNEAAGWGQGDWNGDGFFNSSDFVAAFQDGGYERGPRAAAASVPEPSSLVLLTLGLLMCLPPRRTFRG